MSYQLPLTQQCCYLESFKNRNLFLEQIKMSDGSCLDLRKYQDAEAIQEVYSQIVSGKKGYKAVIERRKDPIKCSACGRILEGNEKFCPECGTKTGFEEKKQNSK